MNIIDIIYYQTFLFYSKRLKENNPNFTTTWGIGIAFAFIIVFGITSIKDIFICNDVKTIYLFIFSLFIYCVFYYYFTKDNKRNKIIKEKPLYRGSLIYSRTITISYFGFAIAMMFIGPILAKINYEKYCLRVNEEIIYFENYDSAIIEARKYNTQIFLTIEKSTKSLNYRSMIEPNKYLRPYLKNYIICFIGINQMKKLNNGINEDGGWILSSNGKIIKGPFKSYYVENDIINFLK